jgi:hypothetical protein
MRPIRYRILLAAQLSQADKLTATAKVATLNTGPEAFKHSFQQIPGTPRWIFENWQFESKDLKGDIWALKFKGAEVCMFYKRQITEVEPLPCDPIPEGVIRDPGDAWVRVDLMGLSARQVSTKVGKEMRSVSEQLALAEKEITAKQAVIDTLETQIFQNDKLLLEKDDTIKKLRGKLRQEKQEQVQLEKRSGAR